MERQTTVKLIPEPSNSCWEAASTWNSFSLRWGEGSMWFLWYCGFDFFPDQACPFGHWHLGSSHFSLASCFPCLTWKNNLYNLVWVRPGRRKEKWDQEQNCYLLGQLSLFSDPLLLFHFLCHIREKSTWSSPITYPTGKVCYISSWRTNRISIFHLILTIVGVLFSPRRATSSLRHFISPLSLPGSHDSKTNFSGWRWTKRVMAVIGNRPKYLCF